MPQRPVVVVLPSLFRHVYSSLSRPGLHCLFHVILLLSAGFISAQAQESPRYLAEIELHTEAELLEALQRSEQLLDEGVLGRHSESPVRFVLHGPEVRILLLQNYSQYKSTVDLAARLSAFGVVDIKVCETWMGGNRVNPEELPPFVGTVPYGPSEERRLRNEEGYIYF